MVVAKMNIFVKGKRAFECLETELHSLWFVLLIGFVTDNKIVSMSALPFELFELCYGGICSTCYTCFQAHYNNVESTTVQLNSIRT